MKRDILTEVQGIIDRRKALLDTDRHSPEVDHMAHEVRVTLREHQDELPVEFILESLTCLGEAPCLIYDDNAHWTVGEGGTQNIILNEQRDKETVFDATWWVGPNRWRRTIREAIRDYLEARDE